MKRTLLLLGFISLFGIFSSCTKEETIYRDYYHNTDHYYNTMTTTYFNIYQNEWLYHTSDIEEYYYYEMTLNELNANIIENGEVSVYIVENSNNTLTLYPLPDVKTYDNGEEIYTQVISFELISPNILAIKSEMTDLQSARPNTLRFKVVTIEP